MSLQPLAIDALAGQLRDLDHEAQAQIDRPAEFIEITETHGPGGHIFRRYRTCHEAIVTYALTASEADLLASAGRFEFSSRTDPPRSLRREDLVALQGAIRALLAAMAHVWPASEGT